MKKINSAAVLLAAVAFSFALSACSKTESKTPAPSPASEASASAEPAKSEAPAAAASSSDLINKQISGIYMSANDLDAGTLTEVTAAEDGFSLNATEDKTLEIQDIAKNPVTVGDDTFTKRISTKGSGKAEFRNISFPAKAGDSIIVYCGSSSKSDPRPLHVVNVDSGEEVGTITMAADGSKNVTVDEVIAPKDGTYCVFSTSGTGYIYQIKVGK